jgi:hypothetical protein
MKARIITEAYAPGATGSDIIATVNYHRIAWGLPSLAISDRK